MVRRFLWPVFSVAALALCGVFAAPPRKSPKVGHVPPLLPRIELLRTLGASSLPLVTDYFWIQTIQAVGKASTPAEYRDIYDYAQLVTELDPKFRQVYVFAGAVIPVSTGRGKWANTEESTRLLAKGVENFPEHVFLHILLAYNYSTYHHDYLRAAQVLEKTARLPEAPPFVGPLATRLYAKAGQVDAGLDLAMALAEQSEDPETRETFEQRVAELHLERVLDRVDEAVAHYQAREGQLPPSLTALVRAGDLPAIPADPLGGSIILGADGRSHSTAQTRRVSDIGEQVTQQQETP